MMVEGRVQLPFRYAAGAAGSRFLAALRDEGRILGARCASCARVLCPARSFCPICGEPTPEQVEVGPGGVVMSSTQVPGRGEFALVMLDGADTPMLHRLLAPATAIGAASAIGAAAAIGAASAIGARVRARFAAARAGSILDIEGFEPEGG